MANTFMRTAKVTDYHGKCKDCGTSLKKTETIISYWNYTSCQDGRTRISEKGIDAIDVNAGICEACQAKRIRKMLEAKEKKAKNLDTTAPGGTTVIWLGIGIFVFTLLLLGRLTRTDEFGNALPVITTWFYIWAGLDLGCVIGLPITIIRKKRLCGKEAASIGSELQLSDSELLEKYKVMNGVPFLKTAWNEYMMTHTGGGLLYASELMNMGSCEKVSKALKVPTDLAADLLAAASQYHL